MKRNLQNRLGLFILALFATIIANAADFRDIKLDLASGSLLTSEELSSKTDVNFGVSIASDGSATRVAADASDANAVLAFKYHDNQHGVTNFKATVPVTGPVKITLGNCAYGKTATVKDATGATIGTINVGAASNCWHGDKVNNVVSTYYKGTNATTLTIEGGGYVPYFAVEAVDPSELTSDITITYSLGETSAIGTAPANATVEAGSQYTLPLNRSLYVEGATLTGWTDGTSNYKPGETITAPAENVTLTPVFTANKKNLADRTSPVTILFDFQKKNGAPLMSYQNTKGIYVTQADVDGEVIDVKLDFDTNNGGKINNGNWNDWCQMNNGTKLTIPSCKGAVVSVEAYAALNKLTIDGQSGYTPGKSISYTVSSNSETIDIVISDEGQYYRTFQTVLPVVAQGGKKYTNEAASVVFGMDDPTNPSASTTTPNDAFSTTAFDYGDLEVQGTVDITKTDGSSSGVKGLKINRSSSAANVNLNWFVRPAAGLTFTPTKVSGYVNRCGTDAEKGIVITAHKTNGDAITLGTYTAWRQGKDKPSKPYDSEAIYQYEITLTAEQQAALASADGFYLTSTLGVNAGKQGAFGKVTIEGTVNGTIADVNKYQVSAVAAPAEGGSVSIYPKSDEYQENDEITLTATKNFGYKFVNWTNKAGEVVSTEPQFKHTVTAEEAFTANFAKLNTYALNYTVEGGAKDYMVSLSPAPTVVDGKNMYEEGTTVTLTASSNEVINFTNWNDGETAAERKVTMDGDKTFTASYAAKDFIAAWDFYKKGNNGRAADFYAEGNDVDQLVLRDAAGNTVGWLDKSQENGGYEGQPGGVNWTEGEIGTYYWQTKVNAEAFSDIKVKSSMMYNYKAYTTYNVEYSLNGADWTKLGSIVMPGRKAWQTEEFTLPTDADNKAEVYIRWIADKTSNIDGSESTKDGNAIGAIYITGTPKLINDGKAPVLVSTVPAENANNASANGKIVLTFDEKVKLTDNAKANLDGKQLSGVVSGKTVTFAYKGLSYATAYTFTLAAGSVADLTDNVIADAINIHFSTKEKPAISKALYDFVVPTDGTFQDAIAAADKRADTGKRFRIFIKQGDYKTLPSTTATKTGNDKKQYPDPTTYLNTPNVSIIGEGMDNTSITNTVPNVEADNGFGPANVLEGIGNGDVLDLNSGAKGTYFQDIKMYSSMGDKRGRDIVLNDKSSKTICKNVNLWAFQDTYVSNNSNDGRFYFENGILRGNTDYLCGKGDVYYNNVDLLMCGTGYLAVPSQPSKYGYIFKDCTIKDGSKDGINGKYTLGRPWGSGTPVALFIDTKMEVIPSAIGWSEMSGGWPARFAEYNSTTTSGSTVDLSGRKTTFANTHTNNPVLTAEEAAQYTIEKVMGGSDDWDPTAATEQASAPSNVKITGNELTWDNSQYALLWAVCKDGKVVDFTIEPSYTVDDATATWSVRAANEMGGLGEATKASTGTGIENVATDANVIATAVYTTDGVQLSKPQRGINIIVKTLADGTKKTSKVIIK